MMRVPKISTSILDMAILGVFTMSVVSMHVSIVGGISMDVFIMGVSAMSVSIVSVSIMGILTMDISIVSYITESCPIWVRAITRSFGESRANESHTRRSLNETGG